MKEIGFNKWFIKHQKEGRLKKYKKFTLFRRYWDDTNKQYTWENTASIDIDKDIKKCGKVIWKLDANELNVWKMGNFSFTASNENGQWNEDNVDGYWNGYVPFLSMVRVETGFIAEDNTLYTIFVYQGLIYKNGITINNYDGTAKIKTISLDYLLQIVNAEDVSRHPLDPQSSYYYYDADIYSGTTIGKTGSGWGINAHADRIVKILSGTGAGQERRILSNTADTLTVNAWATTPDSTSDFKIMGENIGTGNGANFDFYTTQPGVGRVISVWINDTLKYDGVDYNISQLNEKTLQAKITFNIAPLAGEEIACDYIYWYQDQTFKFLVEKILDLANITNREITDLTFPEKLGLTAEVEKEWTSEADWNLGTKINVNTSRFSGDVILEDYTEKYEGIETANFFGHTQDFLTIDKSPTAKSFNNINNYDLLATRIQVLLYIPDNASLSGTFTVSLLKDSPTTGTIVASETHNVSELNWGETFHNTVFSTAPRLEAGKQYFVRVSGTNSSVVFVHNFQSSFVRPYPIYPTYYNDGGWIGTSQRQCYHSLYAAPYHYYGVWISDEIDCGASLQSYGKLTFSHDLNDGKIRYFTKSAAAPGLPTTFDENDWDEVGQFGQILSSVQRYLKVAIKIDRDPINFFYTPRVKYVNIKYYVNEYKPQLANFTGKTGKSAIELMASLSGYEMGFFPVIDDASNLSWDVTYDGTVYPESASPAWVKTTEGSYSSVLSGGSLILKGGGGLGGYLSSFVEAGNVLYTLIYGKLYAFNEVDAWIQLDSSDIDESSRLLNLDEKLYVISNDGHLYGWNTTTEVWDDKTSATSISNGCQFEACEVVGGKIYMSPSGGGSVGELLEWNGTDNWVSKAPQLNLKIINSMINFSNTIYGAAGGDGRLYEWNGSNAWVEVASAYGGAIGHLIASTSTIYGTYDGNLLEWNNVDAWVEKAPKVSADTNSLIYFNNKVYGGTYPAGKLYEWNNVDAWVEVATGNSSVYDEDVYYMFKWRGELFCLQTVRGSFGLLFYGVWKWNEVDDWVLYPLKDQFKIYYTRNESDLDGIQGWTIEARCYRKIDTQVQVLEKEEGLTFEVHDGIYKTKVIVQSNGKVYLMDIDNNIANIDKFGRCPQDDYIKVRVSRKNDFVQVAVNDEIILQTKSDKRSTDKKIIWGQTGNDYATVENYIDYVRYNKTTPAFDLFYLPKYYFKPKNSNNYTGLELKEDENFVKLYNYNHGWDKIYNVIKAHYGDYTYEANPETEYEDRPTSIDTYNKRVLSISGGDFLKKEDTNIAIGLAKRYYSFLKAPKAQFKLLCKFLFQINLADEIIVYCNEPSIAPYSYKFLDGVLCKIIGISLDIDNFTLDLDCEEILT